MIATLLPLALLVASPPPADTDGDSCGASLICGVSNGEDLERVHDTPWVIASSVNGASLYRIDARDRSVKLLDLTIGASTARTSECPGPPEPARFAGHGIAIVQGPRPLLYAINHARGTIEQFEISPVDAALAWSGCIKTPPDMLANGIAPLPDGGLVATNFAAPGKDFTKDLAAGRVTGELRRWTTRDGWSVVPGTEASVANGVAVSDDGQRVFVAVTGTREIWRIDLTHGDRPRLVRNQLDFSPDNLRWDENGDLLTAGFDGSAAEAVACFARPDCSLGYSVAAIDPITLDYRLITRCPATSAFGSATTALRVDGEIWLGTFRGTALARIDEYDVPHRGRPAGAHAACPRS